MSKSFIQVDHFRFLFFSDLHTNTHLTIQIKPPYTRLSMLHGLHQVFKGGAMSRFLRRCPRHTAYSRLGRGWKILEEWLSKRFQFQASTERFTILRIQSRIRSLFDQQISTCRSSSLKVRQNSIGGSMYLLSTILPRALNHFCHFCHFPHFH